jgi:hypothetical protein
MFLVSKLPHGAQYAWGLSAQTSDVISNKCIPFLFLICYIDELLSNIHLSSSSQSCEFAYFCLSICQISMHHVSSETLSSAAKDETYVLSFRFDMDMETQVGYFLNLLRKIFVECNPSEGNSQQSSQNETGSGTASQESEIECRSAVESAVESQQAVVQYLQVSDIFICHCSMESLHLFTP